ncbi:MAG TPA: proline dehydrogenase family protein, partial [Saprospiraceae bacterium]|nr:proline dehydrogenase family protein [Saprospiraceae bacterium]
QRYNKNNAVVYNTFQLYRNDRLSFLKKSFEKAEKEGYYFGAKLVRGAYMDKERKRALETGYASPIHNTKAETDHDYNEAIKYCLGHYEKLGFCNATHNQESCLYMAEEIENRGLKRNHPNLNFCQLYGMSDNLTFNLAKSGYNVAKYVPYGQVKDVVPYLIRRAQENSSVTGDMSREYSLLVAEAKRRGI